MQIQPPTCVYVTAKRRGMRYTSPINNSSCMLNFMCTALKNCILLFKIRFRKSLGNQELFEPTFPVPSQRVAGDLHHWTEKTEGIVSGYPQGRFDVNIFKIKDLLQQRKESVVKPCNSFYAQARGTQWSDRSFCLWIAQRYGKQISPTFGRPELDTQIWVWKLTE